MSAATSTSQAELISSLAQDEIPIKLRCAICSRLAVNAFRLPCCDQAICETCQSTLPSSCPVCEHTPVAAEDCKPHKSLRTTIKVFLRTEEKKREALKLKEVKNTPPDTPRDIDQQDAVVQEEPSVAAETTPVISEVNPDPTPAIENSEEALVEIDNEESDEIQQDIPQPSIEEVAQGQEGTNTGLDVAAHAGDISNVAADDQDGHREAMGKDADGRDTALQEVTGMGAGFGFDPNAAGGFPNMGFGVGGDFNQMQMMMAMQNGMGPNGFANFPMMGMPGMNMDPMTMQNMFMNGGFGAAGMGMNGMNMGMGMGGFDVGMGSGFNNGWNQQQSWNVGPDNFNHPNAATGMGHGDYGANNSGYLQNAAGFNQGNYGYQNNYGYRGRGRGRGGYMQGRGGYGYGQNEAHSQQFPQQFGANQQANGSINETGIPTGPKADMMAAGNVDEFGREIRQSSTTVEENPAEPDTTKDDNIAAPDEESARGNGSSNETPQDEGLAASPGQAGNTATDTKPIQTLEVQANTFNATNGPAGFNPMFPVDPNGRNFGFGRGGFGHNYRGRGNFTMQPPPVKDVPINAPTGPKAMREGLPNTGISGLRGRGFSMVGRPSSRPVAEPVPVATTLVAETQDKDQSRSPSPGPERSRSRSKSRSRTRSRSRSRSRSRDRRKDRDREERHRRKHRHRSTSRSEDERESERRRERRKERRNRHHDEDYDAEPGNDEESADKATNDVDGRRESDENERRSASPRSSHRSRRDKDKDRYRDREKGSDRDREHKSSSHKHRSSHRSYREDRSRSREKDRDRDREHRHSRRHESRRGSVEPDNRDDGTDSNSRKPSVAISTNGIEIKGSSNRKAPEVKTPISIPTGPSKDRLSGRDRERERERSSRHHEDRHRSSRHYGRDSEHQSGRDKDRDTEKEKSKGPPTGPAAGVDPHTLEREARNRERLLKEAQRIAAATGGLGRKRSRDEGDEGSSGRKGRTKKGRRGGAVVADENEEARLSRLEAEREAARWD